MRSRRMLLAFALLLVTGTLVNASPATNADLAIAAGGSTGGLCRYFCGTTIHEGSSSDCCSATFQCPNGQTSRPYGYNNGSGWKICGW